MGVNVVISNLGIQSITNGKRNDMFSLVSGIVLSLAENERRSIAERCLAGRVAARGRGVKFGRKEGVIESDTKFFSKPKVKDIVKDLKNGYPFAVIAKNRDCSISLVQKVSNKLKEQNGEVRVKKQKVNSDNEVSIQNDYDEFDYVKPINGWATGYTKPTGQATWVNLKKKV
jgi:DNA invertase Pin-like site-specific DNA recombinase